MSKQLARLEEYQQALAKVKTPEEAGVLRTQMETIAKQIAPRLRNDRFKWCQAYVESCMKHGEMWNACETKQPVGRGDATKFSNNLEFISISDAMFKNHMDSTMCARIAQLDAQDIELYFNECRTNGHWPSLGGAYNVWKLLHPPDDPMPLPEGIFNVICADPPWKYDNKPEQWGSTNLHYEDMETQAICDLQVGEIADENAVLFLWATNPTLPDAFQVLSAWDFEYKTNMVWVKTHLKKPGSGYYIRGRHELLLIATKGAFTPRDKEIAPPIGSVLQAPVQEHSRKPQEVYNIIERLYPECAYLELFARSKRKGWEVWGDEVGKH